MTAVVVGMVVAALVAFVVISVFAREDEEDSTSHRPGREGDGQETHLEDLLDP